MYSSPTTYAADAEDLKHDAPVDSRDYIAQARKEAEPYACRRRRWRRYAEGDQPLALTDEIREALSGLLENRLCDNVCRQVLSVALGRLQWKRFDVAPNPKLGEAEGLAAAQRVRSELETAVLKNRFASFVRQVNYRTLRDGRHYVGVSWDFESARPVYHHEPAWDGQSGMWVSYDVQGRKEYAVKEWEAYDVPATYAGFQGALKRFVDTLRSALTGAAKSDEKFRFRTVYLPDKILFYRQKQTGANGWEPYPRLIETMDGAVETNEVPWTRPGAFKSRPLGIPVVEFESGLEDSEIVNILGTQDHINELHLSMAGVGRYTAFQRVVFIGSDGKDENGNRVNPDMGAGVVTFVKSPDAKVEVIEPGLAAPLIEILDTEVKTVARTTDTPVHLITGGDQPSGEAILRLEAPLVGKSLAHIDRLTPSYVELLHRTVELLNARGGLDLDEDAPISVEFENPERRNPLDLVTQVSGMREDVSLRERHRLYGYTQAQSEQIVAEMDEEADAAEERAQRAEAATVNGLLARAEAEEREGAAA